MFDNMMMISINNVPIELRLAKANREILMTTKKGAENAHRGTMRVREQCLVEYSVSIQLRRVCWDVHGY